MLASFEDAVAQHKADLGDRKGVVTDRIAALEAELSDLKILQAKLDAADQA